MERQMKEAQCLSEIGLDEKLIQRFIESRCSPERLCILTRYRAELLDKLHDDQRRLECLDYMIYELRKNN